MTELVTVMGEFRSLMDQLGRVKEDPAFVASVHESVSESDVLRRNNVSLMEALGEERKMRIKAERDLSMIKEESVLQKLEADAEIEGHRLATLRLQNQVRNLCEETGLDEVYRLFEAEIKRLSKEVELLRARNLKLESLSDEEPIAQNMETLTSLEDVSSPINAPPFAGYGHRESKRLVSRLRQKNAEAEQLWKECEKLRGLERSHAFSLRQSRDFTRRLNLATQMVQRQKQLVDQEQAEHLQTKTALSVVQHEANALEEECRAQRKEIEALKAEILQYRSRLNDAQMKARQIAKTNNFVAKHRGVIFR